MRVGKISVFLRYWYAIKCKILTITTELSVSAGYITNDYYSVILGTSTWRGEGHITATQPPRMNELESTHFVGTDSEVVE